MEKAALFAEEMRTSYRSLIPVAGSPDPIFDIVSLSVTAQNDGRDIPVKIYIPSEKKDLPIILFIHGGGFVSGDLDTHDVLTRAMAIRTNAIVVSVGYRLAPEFSFPAGLEDVYEVLNWTYNHAIDFGGDKDRIAVSGDSAGANIAAVVAMVSRDRRGPRIAAQWLMYPCVSNKMDTLSWREMGATNFPTNEVFLNCISSYVPEGTDIFTPYVAPLWGRLENLPPALLQVGEYDTLRDENIQYSEALLGAGVSSTVHVYEKQVHGFIQFFKDKAANTEGERALDTGVIFLKSIFKI